MTVTVSEKYQVVIPKEVRDALSLSKGARVSVLAKGGIAYIIPVKPLSKARGMIKSTTSPSRLRDKKDRSL